MDERLNFLATVKFTLNFTDEKGKTKFKTQTERYLFRDSSMSSVEERLNKHLSEMYEDFSIVTITESKIVSVFNEEKQVM